MNSRERYLATILYGTPDKVPFDPGQPREKTLKRWCDEGLPENVDWFEFLCSEIGVKAESRVSSFGLDLVNFKMHPTFEEKVLEHKHGHYIVQDWMGNIVEISDEYDYTYIRSPKDFVTRKWHAFPVSCRADFDEIKKRYNPDDDVRYPENFAEIERKLRNRSTIFSVNFPGPFWQLREWCGFEPLCIMFVEDPEFVYDMISFWMEFVSKTLSRVLENGNVDRIWISEDMAYKSKSMISPHMTREFLMPAWSKWTREAKSAGVQILDMDSDGNISELIPLWIDSGINLCDPVEVAAGNDIVALRKKYGTQIAFQQGIDKRCIAKGGKTIEDELVRIAPVIKSSGYIPGCDHGVPHDISWKNFVHYAKLLAELTGWL